MSVKLETEKKGLRSFGREPYKPLGTSEIAQTGLALNGTALLANNDDIATANSYFSFKALNKRS